MSGLALDPSETKNVGEICELINGRGFKPHEWATDGLPIIRIQNLNGSDDFNYFSGSFNQKIQIETGDLLFAWSGSRGTSFGPHIWRGPTAVLNYHTWKVRPRSLIDPAYLFHALKGITKKIEDEAHGASALVHTQKREMVHYEVWVPDTVQQKAIAEALSDIDDLIAALDALIAKKRDIKQGAMQQLLTGKRRLPGFSGEWVSGQIKDVADLDPTNLGAATPSDWLFNYVSLEDVSQGALLGHTEMAFADAPSRARRLIGRGDILFGTVRPNLKSHCIFDRDGTRWVASTGFCVIRCRVGKSNADYIFEQIMSQQVDEQIERIIAGSNYPAVSGRDVGALVIALPDIEEQKAIAGIMNDMNDEIMSLSLKKAKLDVLRQGMVQNLLTGRIRLI